MVAVIILVISGIITADTMSVNPSAAVHWLTSAAVKETGSVLGLSESAVKVHLHRARSHLRDLLGPVLAGHVSPGRVFHFAGANCDRITAWVIARCTR